MVLEILKFDNFDRPWLLKRLDGTEEQHAHFFTLKEAERVKHLIEINKYPKCKDDRVAMKRLLTDDEYKNLNCKDRYYNNSGYKAKKMR